MTVFRKSSLVALCLTLGAVPHVLAEKAASPPETGELYGGARPVPGKQDPPGLLNDRGLGSLRDLAARLSADRGWLTPEVLEGLDQMSVRLDEIFAEAPNFIEIKGKLYRVALEKVGPTWTSFDARSSYLIFLNHEIYDKLGGTGLWPSRVEKSG